MLSSSVQVNQKGFATLKPLILTGVHHNGPIVFRRVAYYVLSETNLKIKQASPQTSNLTSPNLVTTLRGSLRSEHPNNSLYTYEGTLDLITSTGFPKQVPLGPDQMLLRGAQLRNTPWAYGLVVFTGHETKLMRNARWVNLRHNVLCATRTDGPLLFTQRRTDQENCRRETGKHSDSVPVYLITGTLCGFNNRRQHPLSTC